MAIAWPELQLDDANPQVAGRIAEGLRPFVGPPGAPDPLGVICEMGRIEVMTLSLSARAGGVEAAIIPSPDPTFRFRVGIDPGPTIRREDVLYGESPRTRRAFRLAHEIGHSFFFHCEASLRCPESVTTDEEAFCDEFAFRLLTPSDVLADSVSSPANTLVSMSKRHAVPLRRLARLAADQHRGLVVQLARNDSAEIDWQEPAVAKWDHRTVFSEHPARTRRVLRVAQLCR